MKTLKTAVIGLGIGKSHADVLSKMQGVELAAVADLKPEVLSEVSSRLKVRPYQDGAELLKSEQLDFVCICTPPASHLSLTQAAAARGAHVFCEKPMASSLKDCDGMISACKGRGLKLMIGQKKRFHPSFQFVKERLGGEFGQARWVTVRYALGRVGWTWFWDEKDGGGPLVENSVHAMDILRFLLGEPERVYAEGGNLFNPKWAPQIDTAAISIKFRSGAIAAVGCGQASEWGFASEGTYLSTDNAVIEITGGFDRPDNLRYILRTDTKNVMERRFEGIDLFTIELSHFVDCVRSGGEPMIPGEDARRSIALCLAVKESIRTAKPVTFT